MVASQKKLERHIAKLLEKDAGRFSNYQQIPPIILEKFPMLKNIDYRQKQVDIDTARYNWLKNQYKKSDFTAIEIGANLGFFTLSLAAERNASVIAYEPIPEYAAACQALSQMSHLSHKVNVSDTALGIEDLKSLAKADLIINLNVLHHAGSTFDVDSVKSVAEWSNYAKKYLIQLSQKASYLFFQTGNMWNNQPLFPSEAAVHYVKKLLGKANWGILTIGVIEDYKQLYYKNYGLKEIDQIARIYCRRNKQTKLVDYFLDGKLIASFKTGLAQRPLWFCRSDLL